MSDEENSPNTPNRLPSTPDGYLRISDIWKAIGAFIGFTSLLFTGNAAFDRLRDWMAVSLQNERVERINADNKIEQRIDSCCRRR